MAPRRDASLTVPSQSSSLQQLLSFARLVLQQTARGLDPGLSVSELSAAWGAASALAHELSDEAPLSEEEFTALWSQPGQDAAAYVALLALALRRARFSPGDGRGYYYADIVSFLSYQLHTLCFVPAPVLRKHICGDVLAPALLGADALECYSRLLADIAEELKPAAAAALLGRADGRSTLAIPQGGASAAAAGGRPGRHRCTYGHSGQPHSSQASSLTSGEALRIVDVTTTFLSGIVDGVFRLGSSSDSRGSGGSSSSNSRSGGGSSGSGGSSALASSSSGGGGGSGAWAATQHDRHVHQLRTRMHSSAVVDNLAQVLLLSTVVAPARDERLNAAAALARSANWLCRVKHATDFRLSLFLRRPCGCALAAAHMAQLCAALDGGDAFGAAKPEVLVMPACTQAEFRYLVHTDSKAKKYDEVAMRLKRAANLHAAIVIAAAWTRLQRTSRALQEPPCKAAGTRRDGACPTEAVSAGQGGAGASQQAVSVGQEGGGGGGADDGLAPEDGHTAADMCLHKLPPFNRTATIHLCLRLAKGVLACWGRPLPGVRLELPSENPSAPAPLMPKEHGCALLHQALACARLALLPAAWGRERVPRRTRAQLRAWWETCVAAAQHPEALAVGEPVEPANYPEWMSQQGGSGACDGLSADATAAMEAGLLPCLTQMVDRMGTGNSSGTVWHPPSIFPVVQPCLADVLQFGPLGPVGQLVSAVGVRLRGAVEELRVSAAEGGGAGWRCGERALWLANVVRHAMVHTETCLSVLVLRWRAAHKKGAAADSAGPGSGPLASESHAPAAAAAPQCPLRSSFALAELLPALSASVRLSGELVARVVAGESRAGERGGCGADDAAAGSDQIIELVELVAYGCSAAVTAMDCVVALLAKWCQEAAAEALGSRGGGGGGSPAPGAAGGCGSGGFPSCGSRGGGGSPCCAGDSAPGEAWRQLLMQDVRLMELLGAGVALYGELSRAAAAGLLPPGMNINPGLLPPGMRHRPDLTSLRDSLSGVLPLAALTFPGEFRAAVEGGAGPVGAKAEAPKDEGPSPRPCMSPAAVQTVLEREAAHGVRGPGQKGVEGLKAVVRVVGGWDPPPGEAWDLARGCCVMYELDLAEVVEMVRGMSQPEEARAAVAAAAAAAAAGASGSGPG